MARGDRRGAWTLALIVAASGCPRSLHPRAHTLPDATTLNCPSGASVRVHLDGAHCVRAATGQRHGPFASFWPDGAPMARGAYVDGELDGEWIVRYQDGALRSQGHYLAGVRTGAWAFDAPDGRPLRREVLAAGEVIEEIEYTYAADGALAQQRSRRRIGDRLVEDGEQRERLPGSREVEILHRTAGVVVGPLRVVDDAGVERVAATFVAGQPAGHAIGRRPSGTVAIEGDFAGGRLAGTWRHLDDDGRVRLAIEYDGEGWPQRVTAYHPGGEVALDGALDRAGPTGRWRRLAVDGAVLVEGTYRDGLRDGTWQTGTATARYAGGLLVGGVAAPPLRWQPLAEDEGVAMLFMKIGFAAAGSARTGAGSAHDLYCLAGGPPETACAQLDWEQTVAAVAEGDRARADRRQALACALGDLRACFHHAARLHAAAAPFARVVGTLASACERLDDEEAGRRAQQGKLAAVPAAARACGVLGAGIVDGKVGTAALDGWELLERGCGAGEGDACARAAVRLAAARAGDPALPAPVRADPRAAGRALRERACAARAPSAEACAAIAAELPDEAARPWRERACDAGDEASCAALGRELPTRS
jgi:antitoxin component YwqK of YwqJK toxin-antitoxin module